MKINMKVKHLLMTVVGVALLSIFITQVVIPRVQTAEISNIDQIDSETDNVMQLLADEKLSDRKRKELIEQHLLGFGVEGYRYDLTIGSGTMMSSSLTTATNAVKIPHLKWYKENTNEKTNYYYQAVILIAYDHAKKGDMEKAIQLLDNTFNQMEIGEKNWHVYLAYVELLALVDQEKAITKINDALGYPLDAYTESTLIRTRTNLFVQQQSYQQALESLSDFEKDDIVVDYNRYFTIVKENLENRKDGKNLYQVTGSLKTADGKPISFAKVYLRTKDNVNHSIIAENEAYYATTNAKGDFTVNGIPRGNYQIHLSLDFDQISGYKWTSQAGDWYTVKSDQQLDMELQPLIVTNEPANYQAIKSDKVKFGWEAVPDAAYYKLGFGLEYNNGTGSSTLSNKRIYDTEVTLPITELYQHQLGIAYEENEAGEMEVIPESLLGFANPNADSYWYVDAYDENDELLTSSKGYRLTEESMGDVPYFQITRTLTEADKLLLDGELDRAIESYKAKLTTNGNNIHALRMLVKLLQYGDRDWIKESKVENQDVTPYLKQLAQLTNNHQHWFDLSQLAFESGNWEKYFDYYDKELASLNGDTSDYSKSIYAIALMKNGKEQEAEKLFQQLVASDDGHRFMPAWATLKYNQTKDFSVAKQLAQDYPLLGYYGMETDWANLFDKLENHISENSQAKQMLEKGLELYMSGKEEELRQWIDQQSEGIIRTYFEELNQL